MILRALGSIGILGLLALNFALPSTSMGRRGAEERVREDVESRLVLGERLPSIELVGLDGRRYSEEDLLGHRVLLTFERSVDW